MYIIRRQKCKKLICEFYHNETDMSLVFCWMPMHFKGWTYGIGVSCLLGAMALFMYPIAIAPMINSAEYRRNQARNRAGVKQEEIQPGGMKVWSDPFERKK
ncbi:unnamed protein product [Allacma fusca]|uniref:Uncharacterized protein n=2 Tax=Allacma fusca TaxID=39272 RepID=A0A8J2PVY9_9HEXA|nr:unnamed protein product [Allacma fusca]